MKIKSDFGQHPPLRKKRFPDVLEHIKLIMADLNLTQAEVAGKLGIQQPYLSHILKGNKPFSIENILRFAEAYSVNLNWLLLGTETNKYRSAAAISEKEKQKLLSELQKLHSESAIILKKILEEKG